jgi:dihydrofolate reductase
VKLIVAVNNDGVIGNEGSVPWVCKEDLRHFYKTTVNNIVIMGRNTFESLGSRPLTKRYNIILTSDTANHRNTKNAFFASSMEQCLQAVDQRWKKYPESKAFVIGGQFVYEEFLRKGLITEILLTQVWNDMVGDAFFELPKGWVVEEQEELCDEATLYTYKKRVKKKRAKRKKKK